MSDEIVVEPEVKAVEPVQEKVTPEAEPKTEPPKPDDKKVEQEQEQKPHKNRFQQRIIQLVNKNKAIAERLEALEKKQTVQEQKPVREQFQSDEQFIDALADHKLRERLPEVQKQVTDGNRFKEIEKNFLAKEAQAKTSIEDYDDVIAESADIPVQASVADAILSSDVGPNLRYYLASHPDEALKLNEMTPGAAARHIGKIEVMVEADLAKKKDTTKKVSSAPAPVKPISSGGESQGIVDLNDSKMSIDDWMKKRREQRVKAHVPLKRTQ